MRGRELDKGVAEEGQIEEGSVGGPLGAVSQ